MTTDLATCALAAHVLRLLAKPRARVLTIDDVAQRVQVRRGEVRKVVSQLHREGFVDALRMRTTMTGLAAATAMRSCKLRDARPEHAESERIAVCA